MITLETERPEPDCGRLSGDQDYSEDSQSTTKRPEKKWKRVLRALVSGDRPHRFDAERRYHDHCLHSTVSFLESKGLTIERQEVQVPGYCGETAHVKRYWLADESMPAALKLLSSEAHIAPRAGV